MCENICKFEKIFIVVLFVFVKYKINSYFFQGEMKSLDDKSILSNLKDRFQSQMIYVSIYRF